jgi:hypothetical protein
MELWESYGRVGRKTEGPEEDMDSTETPTESTNLDHWELPETESPTKEYVQAGPTPPPRTYVADEQLGLHVGSPNN